MTRVMPTTKAYKIFAISDIFDIYTWATIRQDDLFNGTIPRITATDVNNWIALFTNYSDHRNFRALDNFISISFLWSVFYQNHIVSLDMKIHWLKIKNRTLNKHIWLFLVPLIKNFTLKYSYGYQLSTSILRWQKLLLPVDDSWQPDRDYMEETMKKIEHKLLTHALQYFENKLQKQEMRGGGDLINKQWGEFFVEDIFDTIQRWKRLKKQDHIEWKIPYISSTATNNGVDAYIANTENIRKFNYCLTLANSGSIGATFYQPFSFIASDHVTKLENKLFSKYIYLFISTKLQKLGDKYSFNREINDKRIKREKMLLPIDDNYQPDYDFMDQYMRQIERRQIKKYIERKIGGIKKLSYNI